MAENTLTIRVLSAEHGHLDTAYQRDVAESMVEAEKQFAELVKGNYLTVADFGNGQLEQIDNTVFPRNAVMIEFLPELVGG